MTWEVKDDKPVGFFGILRNEGFRFANCFFGRCLDDAVGLATELLKEEPCM